MIDFYDIVCFLLKIFAYSALFLYVIWALFVLYRIIFKPGKNGSLPWL